ADISPWRLTMRANHSPRRRRLLSGLAIAASAALMVACTGPAGTNSGEGGDSGGGGSDGDVHFAVITHGTQGDAFWNAVKNGAEDAGTQLGVGVEYASAGHAGAQARPGANAASRTVDGSVVSMANPDALKGAIENAVEADIPVITINSGSAQSKEFGAIAHVGQEEDIAGEEAGKRLKEDGKKKLLCVIHEAGNIGLNQRCDGAKRGFGGQVKNLQVDINNPTDIESRIRGALQADSAIDSVLTLNPQVAVNAVNAAKDANSSPTVATFDLNSDVVAAVQAGEIEFAVDQQQYQQGYLPIVMLKLYVENANTLGGGQPVLTGPGFVDKSNV